MPSSRKELDAGDIAAALGFIPGSGGEGGSGFTLGDTYNPALIYPAFLVVYANGSSYVSKRAIAMGAAPQVDGEGLPVESVDWLPIARRGHDGGDGSDGDDGLDGRSIVTAAIDGGGRLRLVMTDGDTIDAGRVVGPAGGELTDEARQLLTQATTAADGLTDALVSLQTIYSREVGLPSAIVPVNASNASALSWFAWAEPADRLYKITGGHNYSDGAGTLTIFTAELIGGLIQLGASATVAMAVGENTFTSANMSAPITVEVGQLVGLHGSVAGVINFKAEPADSDGTYVFNAFGTNPGAASVSTRIQGGLYMEAQAQTVTASALRDLQAATAALPEMATAVDALFTTYDIAVGLPSDVVPQDGSNASAASWFLWDWTSDKEYQIVGGHNYSDVAGALTIFVADIVGGMAVVLDSLVVGVAAASVNSFTATRAMVVPPGKRVGIHGSAAGVVNYVAASSDSGGWYAISNFANPLPAKSTTTRIQGGLYLRAVEQTVTADRLLNIESTLSGLPADLGDVPEIWRPGRLWRIQTESAQRLYAGSGSPTLVFAASDSIIEYRYMMQPLIDHLRSRFGNGGHGWISTNTKTLDNQFSLDGIVSTWTGWSTYDANQGSAPPLCGCGLDGIARYTTGSAATATYQGVASETLTGLRADILDIYTFDGPDAGPVRYRINNQGEWQEIAPSGAGVKKKTTVTATGTPITRFDIDTATNTNNKTAAVLGFRGRNTAGGIEVCDAGNAGLAGDDFSRFAANTGWFFADIKPAAVASYLGTNCYADAGMTPEIHKQAMRDLAAQVYGADPTTGLLIIAPNQTDRMDAVRPLADYVRARFEVAGESAVRASFWSWYDQDVSLADLEKLGLIRADHLHSSDRMGRWRAPQLVKFFL